MKVVWTMNSYSHNTRRFRVLTLPRQFYVTRRGRNHVTVLYNYVTGFSEDIGIELDLISNLFWRLCFIRRSLRNERVKNDDFRGTFSAIKWSNGLAWLLQPWFRLAKAHSFINTNTQCATILLWHYMVCFRKCRKDCKHCSNAA